MNIDFNLPLEQQSTAALRHLLTLSEEPSEPLPRLARDITLRGIHAEIDSRSTIKMVRDSVGKEQPLRVHH